MHIVLESQYVQRTVKTHHASVAIIEREDFIVEAKIWIEVLYKRSNGQNPELSNFGIQARYIPRYSEEELQIIQKYLSGMASFVYKCLYQPGFSKIQYGE